MMADTSNDSGSKITDGSAFETQVTLSDDVKEEANRVKTIANQYFKDKDYEQAVTYYSKAIELNPDDVTYYGNRSFAHIKLENFGYALNNASKALDLDKTYIKAYYRRASANMALGKFKLALKDFEAVTKRCPNDKDAKNKYSECKKIVNRINFEKAIAVDDSLPISETIDIDGICIEDSYTGPHLEDGKSVTPHFMLDLMETFKNQGKLHKKHAYRLLCDAKALFQSQESLVDVHVPEGQKFTVCGDIHGQFYDLMNIFTLNGVPSKENPYLFNGDFVDRGSFSVECILTLLGYKLLYPQHFYMSRGNHESETMNQMYGFDGEVKSKYNAQMADLFTEVYNWLPLCHLLNNKILVMHGGLFKDDGVKIDDLRVIDRNRQPPESGLMCDLLWSDPQPQIGRSPSKRGVGTQFGPDVTRRFLEENDLDYVIRSHEVKSMGYEKAHGGKCITVFSAPNYCDTMGNKGAFITIRGDDLDPTFTSYDAVPHPNVKPMAYANSFLSMLA